MINKYELFNKKLLEFAEDLIFICPEVHDFRIFRDSCTWAMKIKQSFPEELFYVCVCEPYSKEVIAKDETFFI